MSNILRLEGVFEESVLTKISTQDIKDAMVIFRSALGDSISVRLNSITEISTISPDSTHLSIKVDGEKDTTRKYQKF